MLAPESDLFEDLDSAGFGEALNTALQSSLANPDSTARATLQWATDLARIPMVAATRWFGREIESPVPVDPKDRRFADPAWSTNPVFYGMRLAYLSTCRYARDVVAAASVDEAVARKAELALNLALDALAPTNFLATNPAALKRAFDTAGASVVKGAMTFLDDLAQQQRPAAPGRRQRLRGGPQPRRDAGQGRVPQRAHGAHPVRAADRAGARPAAAVQPAVDQQVLRHGPRARAAASSSGRCSTAARSSRSAT